MSVSQATIQTKSKARVERGPAWHRSTTRKTILDTAREMIEADGLEKTTLLRIAEKAGFAPTTVYAYFVRKADLISAVVADDLSNFARTIKDGFPFSEVPEPEAEADAADSMEAVHAEIMEHCASEADEPSPHAEQDTDSEVVDYAPASFDMDTEETPAEERHVESGSRTDRPVEAAIVANHDAGTLAAMEARIAQLEARRADPWLERRLREFERMLAALDERVGAAGQANAGTAADARVQEVLDRLEAFEKKQAAVAEEHMKALTDSFAAREAGLRQAQTELRTMTLETSGRLEVLERDRELRALAVEMPAVEFARKEPAAVETPAPESAVKDTPEASVNAEESYLAAARRAAQTAQSLAQSEEKSFSDEVSSWMAPGKTRTRLLVSLCAGLGVVLLGTGFLLSHRATAAATPTVHAPTIHVAKHLLPPETASRGADFASVYTTALAGNPRAQLQMGLVYLSGAGVTEDDTRAGHWLEAAAQQGQPVAQYWLATLFEHGKGESVDPAESIRWYEAAALQGNLKAMYKLAVSYAEGWGTRQNYGEAARWFSRAAELGFVNAQFNLGVLYERGYGTPQSLLDAYKWYALAAAQGDKDSAARVDALSSQLTPEDLETARDAATGFKPQLLNAEANDAPALPSVKPAAVQTAASALKH